MLLIQMPVKTRSVFNYMWAYLYYNIFVFIDKEGNFTNRYPRLGNIGEKISSYQKICNRKCNNTVILVHVPCITNSIQACLYY